MKNAILVYFLMTIVFIGCAGEGADSTDSNSNSSGNPASSVCRGFFSYNNVVETLDGSYDVDNTVCKSTGEVPDYSNLTASEKDQAIVYWKDFSLDTRTYTKSGDIWTRVYQKNADPACKLTISGKVAAYDKSAGVYAETLEQSHTWTEENCKFFNTLKTNTFFDASYYSDSTNSKVNANFSVENSGAGKFVIESPEYNFISYGCGQSDSFQVVLDSTDETLPVAPTVSLEIETTDFDTYEGLATINLSASDDIGIVGYYVSDSSSDTPQVPNSDWISVDATTDYADQQYVCLDPDERQHNVYVWFRDMAGNISDMTSDTLDMDAP